MNWAAVSHGLPALVFAYAVTGIPMIVGLLSQRASLVRILKAPLMAIPVTVAALIVWQFVRYFWAKGGVLPHGAALYWVGSVVLAAVGGFAGILLGGTRPSAMHERGTLIEEGRRTRIKRGEVSMAGIPIPALDETKHFKLIGTTGTGKSTAIRELLQGTLDRGDRVIIADPDGGYLNRFYDRNAGDAILNPFDKRSSRWDLFAEIDQPYDVEQLARALIPDQDGADRTWRNYARTFVTAVARQLWELGARDPAQRNLAELYRLVSMAPAEELKILVENTPAQPFLESGNERMFGSLRSVASAHLAALEHIAQQSGPALSIRHWVRGGQGVGSRALFLPYTASQISALHSTISAWMRLAIFESMSGQERDQRLWFIIDELDALGQIDGLKDALARLRKFGGRCVLGFQSIAQVSSTYGQGEAQTIVENCGNTLILRCSASEQGGTAQFASRLIGQRQVLRRQESRTRQPDKWSSSTTISEQRVLENAVLPSEIEQLPDLAGYLKLASSPCWQRVQIPLTRL
jgi:type IV secretory pathway TraG/TraD family ATPase VirD4